MENEQSNYYPFGLKHNYNNYPQGNIDNGYKYKFNGKELQDELGLDWYEYGARNYDASLGRWMNVDFLAEKFIGNSPYAFVANNPIINFDPDGRDIYRYDNKTGELVLHQETDDDFDIIGKFKKRKGEYILKTDKEGNSKIHVNNIAKGILHDGINFREENNTIAVNGTNEDGSNQPTTKQVEDFILEGSNALGKEVSGYGLGSEITDGVENILIWKTKDNSFGKAYDMEFKKDEVVNGLYLNVKGYQGEKLDLGKNRYAKYHFHTHPNVEVSRRGGIDTPSEPDMRHAATVKLPHYILNINGKFQYNEKGTIK